MAVKTPEGTLTSWEDIIAYAKAHPEVLDDWLSNMPQFREMWNLYQTNEAFQNGKANANDVLGAMGPSFINPTPETEKYIDNLIARENTASDRTFQTEMRDTSLTSAGAQLAQLGLSTSNVIQTGGASSGVVSGAASQNMHSVASLRQQERINSFNQKMGLAKSLISAAGSMASSGIYGAALGAIKNSAAKVATAAAHSGRHALDGSPKNGHWSKMDDQQWNQLMSDLGY